MAAEIEPMRRRANLIWGALIGAVALFALVVETLLWNDPAFAGFIGREALPLDTLRLAFGAVAASLAVAAFLVRAWLLPRAGRTVVKSPAEAAQREFVAHVVALSMADNISILGLVLFLLAGERTDFLLFALPGLAVLLALRPGAAPRLV
jgi:hypothetical protein